MATSENLSRGDMIQWINDILKLNISKIECLGTGAIHCQLIDCIYPGKVQLSKVNWKAKQEYEYVQNFKVLQQAFTKLSINKPIPVERLVKCKYQDNLEFAQWIKKYYDQNIDEKINNNYDAIQRRGINIEADFTFIEGKNNLMAGILNSSTNSRDSGTSNGGNNNRAMNQLKKQVAPRYATSILISTNSNELNKSQHLNHEKKDYNNYNNNSPKSHFKQESYDLESIVLNKNQDIVKNQFQFHQQQNAHHIRNVQSSYVINSYRNSNEGEQDQIIEPQIQQDQSELQQQVQQLQQQLQQQQHQISLLQQQNEQQQQQLIQSQNIQQKQLEQYNEDKQNQQQILLEQKQQQKQIIIQQKVQEEQQQQNNNIKMERDFYFEKLKNIDRLLEIYEEYNLGDEVDELVFKVKDLLYTTPSQSVQINPNSTIQINDIQQSNNNNQSKQLNSVNL